MIKNLKLILMYDGTNFYGSQKNENLRTIEGVLNLHLKKILNEDINLTFASRTDRGVHALGQVVNFKVDTKIPTKNIKKILNNKLPDDLSIKEIEEVDLNFSSRFDSKGKVYFFIVNNSFETPNPILNRYSLWFPYKIDYNRLKENITFFIGKKDFSSFTTEEEREKGSTIREILDISFLNKDNLLFFIITGKSFLRHQIRRMIGSLLEIERRNLESQLLTDALNSEKHFIGEKKISSRGLFLYKVIY
ncbi:MAG TPA: tRNA pseudouridine(38-40) synthase TruA [Caldisericia bacterium]|nr:tRNA pseudouridine(38-40) synthase TruA [Caldisericia bacterium]